MGHQAARALPALFSVFLSGNTSYTWYTSSCIVFVDTLNCFVEGMFCGRRVLRQNDNHWRREQAITTWTTTAIFRLFCSSPTCTVLSPVQSGIAQEMTIYLTEVTLERFGSSPCMWNLFCKRRWSCTSIDSEEKLICGPQYISGPQNIGHVTGYSCDQDKQYYWDLLLLGWSKTCN